MEITGIKSGESRYPLRPKPAETLKTKKAQTIQTSHVDTVNISGKDKAEASRKKGGKVAVNVGKRARQIAAAKSREQIQQVLALLREDLADCKAGLAKGWCDESEIAKVEALMNQAKARLSQVPQKSDDSQAGIDAFDLASLM